MKKNLLLVSFSQFIQTKQILDSWNIPLDLEQKLVVLYILWTNTAGSEVTSQEDIVQVCNLNKSKVCRILNELEDRGIVKRNENRVNKRKKVISLTANFKFENREANYERHL